MPGSLDVWNHVTPAPSLRSASTRLLSPLRRSSGATPVDGPSSDEQAVPRSNGRALRLGALAAALLVLAGGSLATASAHKTVTLDIDGTLTDVSTFAGSVDGLLQDEGVQLGERDVVTPASADALQDGTQVVVRHARALVVSQDGDESTVWTTALSADEALATLAARGEDVRLVPSRSAATGRPELTVDLSAGPVDVIVDGRTEQIADGSIGLDQALSSLGITVGELDRVHVQKLDSGRLGVVVQRVVAQEQTTLTELPFETVSQPSADLFKGESATAVEGAVGEQTTVHRVVLVDGVEEARFLLSDAVTREPVAKVVHEGTKVRPAPVAPKPAATPAPARSAAPRPGATAAPTAPAVVSGDVWGALAQCESGGNPTIISSNGLYYGLYQFSLSTWRSVGGSGLPSDASPDEQTQRAQALQARSGWGQWPHCAAKLGLL